MRKSFNNTALLIVFLVLAGIFILTKIFPGDRSQKTLNTRLVEIDTSRITEIMISRGAGHDKEIRFEKQGEGWMVSNGEIKAKADPSGVKRLLGELVELKTDRLVARSSEAFADYHVDDSLGSRITIDEGRKRTLDMMVGRFHYQPPAGGYAGYGQNYGTGQSFVRLSGKDEVYTVEGYLSMSVNQPLNSWRNNSFIHLDRNRVSKLVFTYPADSGFVMQKNDNIWLIDGIQADSARVADYLGSISRKSATEFWDGPEPGPQAEFSISIEGDNMEPVLLEAYHRQEESCLMHSSHNPEAWFVSSIDGIFGEIFKSGNTFFTGLP